MMVGLKVIPGARKILIKEEKGLLKVYLTSPAVDGKANKQLMDLLSKHYNVRKNRIEIIKGLKSRYKTVIINDY